MEEQNLQTFDKLSPFHKAIARRVASGERMKDISTAMRISASRLSILKNSPIMKQAITHYETVVEKGFEKARTHLDDHAEEAAQVITESLRSDNITESEKVKISFGLLDRLGIKEQQLPGGKAEKGQLMFEQTLKVIQNSSGETTTETLKKVAKNNTLEPSTEFNNTAINNVPEFQE